jgi:hypothetical protein
MIEFARFFDSRRIPDEALDNLRQLVTLKVLDVAPTLALWLRSWCEVEAEWRTKDEDNRPARHVVALPPVDSWNDRQLAAALRGCTALSYIDNLDAAAGELIDRITLAISEHAATRLERAS